MDMHLVDELVEIVLVTGAEIDKSLDGLVRISGYVLSLTLLDHSDGVIRKLCKVRDAVVHVGGFVNADKWLIEDREEVTEQVECDRLSKQSALYSNTTSRNTYLFYDAEHHGLVTLPRVKLEQLL